MENNWSALVLCILFIIVRSNGQNSFDWEFFKVASLKKGHQNMVISPYSIKLLLSILREAAFDRTEEELSQALGDIPNDQSRDEYFNKTLNSLQEHSSSYELYLGTKFFIDKHLNPAATLLKIVEKVFRTSIERVKFNDVKETADKINDWCSNITKGHLQEVVDEDMLVDSVTVLANAIYFKGTWKNQFNVQSTSEKDFKVTSKETVKVQSMFRSGKFDYYCSKTFLNGVKVLRLPYKGDKYAMKILLPFKEDGLDNLIASFNQNEIKSIHENLRKTPVKLRLPKFEFATEFNLKECLKMLGIENIFSNSANLTGFGERAKVSDVVQKAGLVVDEKGTEIFAATAKGISPRSLVNVEDFNVNHPFVFFLEDESTGAILLAGKVVNPLE